MSFSSVYFSFSAAAAGGLLFYIVCPPAVTHSVDWLRFKENKIKCAALLLLHHNPLKIAFILYIAFKRKIIIDKWEKN